MSARHQPLPRSRSCFVCGAENGRGFRLKFYLNEAGVQSHVIVPEDMAGYDGMAHGGIVATLLDEAMGWAANCHLKSATTTGELSIRYRRATPVGEELLLEGAVVRSRGPLCFTEGRLTDGAGVLMASGKGKFMGRPEATGEMVSAMLVHEPGDVRIFDGAS